MTRGCLVRMLLALLLLATTTASSNEDLVLPPLPDATGPAKLLVLVPGANVATSYYNATARAIQAHTTNAKLWVVVPKIPGETCIAFCPSPRGPFMAEASAGRARVRNPSTGLFRALIEKGNGSASSRRYAAPRGPGERGPDSGRFGGAQQNARARREARPLSRARAATDGRLMDAKLR